MSLVFVAQRLYEDDPVLGIVPELIRALAARDDRVDVIVNELVGRPALGDNVSVRSLGKESGFGRTRRTTAFLRESVASLSHHPDAMLVHMSPVYVDIAAVPAKAFGVPLMLWFAHPAESFTLKMASRAADAVLTSLPGAFPIPGPKVHVIGQAIDVEAFVPVPPPRDSPLRLLALGRTSPSKRFPTLIEAVRLLGSSEFDVRLRIVGPSTTDEERRHRGKLQRLVDGPGLRGIVSLEDGVPRSDVPRLIANCHILLNGMVAGSGDKVAFEAMAMERPVIASNPALGQLLGDLPLDLTFPEGDAVVLADRIRRSAMSDPSVRQAVGAALRSRVVSDHSIAHWANSVLAVARTLRSGGRIRSGLA